MLCNHVLPIQLCMSTPHRLLAFHCTRPVSRYRLAFASSITRLAEAATLGISNFTLREGPAVGLLYFHFVLSATQELLPRTAIAPRTIHGWSPIKITGWDSEYLSSAVPTRPRTDRAAHTLLFQCDERGRWHPSETKWFDIKKRKVVESPCKICRTFSTSKPWHYLLKGILYHMLGLWYFSVLFKIFPALTERSAQTTRSEGFFTGRQRVSYSTSPGRSPMFWHSSPLWPSRQVAAPAVAGGEAGLPSRAMRRTALLTNTELWFLPRSTSTHGLPLPQADTHPHPGGHSSLGSIGGDKREQLLLFTGATYPGRSKLPVQKIKQHWALKRDAYWAISDSLIPSSDRITGCWEISNLKNSSLRLVFSICQTNIENCPKSRVGKVWIWVVILQFEHAAV